MTGLLGAGDRQVAGRVFFFEKKEAKKTFFYLATRWSVEPAANG
jgi:hypothetical protein